MVLFEFVDIQTTCVIINIFAIINLTELIYYNFINILFFLKMKLKYELTLSKPKKNLPFNNINNIRSTSRIQCMSISPNMVKLAVCYSNTNYVELYDLNSNELKDKFALKSSGSKQSFQVIGMTFADDSERLAIGQSDNLIYVYKVGISWFVLLFIIYLTFININKLTGVKKSQ